MQTTYTSTHPRRDVWSRAPYMTNGSGGSIVDPSPMQPQEGNSYGVVATTDHLVETFSYGHRKWCLIQFIYLTIVRGWRHAWMSIVPDVSELLPPLFQDYKHPVTAHKLATDVSVPIYTVSCQKCRIFITGISTVTTRSTWFVTTRGYKSHMGKISSAGAKFEHMGIHAGSYLSQPPRKLTASPSHALRKCLTF
jgi:hypothetical protein